MYESNLSTIGSTPLVKLTRLFSPQDSISMQRWKHSTPGGSIKDRAALNIIKNAIEMGLIKPGDTVESSSGNMGIGVAQACAYMGYLLFA
jgi:cysteine synthase